MALPWTGSGVPSIPHDRFIAGEILFPTSPVPGITTNAPTGRVHSGQRMAWAFRIEIRDGVPPGGATYGVADSRVINLGKGLLTLRGRCFLLLAAFSRAPYCLVLGYGIGRLKQWPAGILSTALSGSLTPLLDTPEYVVSGRPFTSKAYH